MRKIFFIVLAGFVACLFAACTSLDCSIDNVVALNVSIPDTVSDDTLNVYTIINGKDTALYTNGLNTTSVSLPMSYGQDADTYIFAFAGNGGVTTADTIVVSKTNQPYFESVDCSPQFWHNIQSVTTTHNMVDSVTINNPEVNNVPSIQHIILHLHRN